MSATALTHYVTLDDSQIRVWRSGDGPDLLVLPGLLLSAEATAARVAVAAPGWTVTTLELPGLGGSVSSASITLDEAADHLAAACRQLGFADCALVAFDLAAPLADRLAARMARSPLADIRVGVDRARAWARRCFAPNNLAPRADGTHLTALWAHIRDGYIIDAADPRLPAFDGEALPTPEELHATFTAAALQPEIYAALWSACLAAVEDAGSETTTIPRLADLGASLHELRPRMQAASSVPPTRAHSGDRIWNDYVTLPAGRLHVRRAGGQGRPLLLFPSGGGSSETFAIVARRLARTHQVVAVDYFGNGESDKLDRPATIETFAEDARQLADALGFERLDLWGSHTGALIAMELAAAHPQRIGKAVLEGPVFISADFQADLLEKYFPPLKPDAWGLHLQLFWNWRRDMFMYWPWYRVAYDAARRLGIPDPQDLHRFFMGIMQSGSHYGDAYRTAYIYDTAKRIGLVQCPALVCAGPNDMLVDGLPHAKRLSPASMSVMLTPTTAWWPAQNPNEVEETLSIYDRFFAGKL